MALHVLVAFDGSPHSWTALERVREGFDADRITVLTVVDPVRGEHRLGPRGAHDVVSYDRAVESAESLCAEAKAELTDAGIEEATVETAVEIGQPARTIVSYADEHDVDHVVVGSHGRSGVSRALFGSVAETVARRSPVPVTIAR